MATKLKRPKWPFPQHGKLTAHPRGHWCKWLDRGTRYFGRWRTPDHGDEFAKAALKRYLAYVQAKADQRPVQLQSSDLTLHIAINHYLTARDRDLAKGNLSPGQFVLYKRVGRLLIDACGRDKLVKDLSPADFEFLRGKITGGPVRVGNQIQSIRSIFKWVGEYYGIYPRYGGQFNRPDKREVRRSRKLRPLFEPTEIQKLLKVASPALRCFILLGINCGFGQADCAKLTVAAVDLKKRLITFDRPKTGIKRVCPLWPETVNALQVYRRPNANLPHLYFITTNGKSWINEMVHLDEAERLERVTRTDSIRDALELAAEAAKVPMRGFYLFRHTFSTIAEGAADPNARKVIMGHAFGGMDEFYLHLHQQPEFMKRLQKIVNFVKIWLYNN